MGDLGEEFSNTNTVKVAVDTIRKVQRQVLALTDVLKKDVGVEFDADNLNTEFNAAAVGVADGSSGSGGDDSGGDGDESRGYSKPSRTSVVGRLLLLEQAVDAVTHNGSTNTECVKELVRELVRERVGKMATAQQVSS